MNGEWGMGNDEWEMGNGKWEIENGKLIFLHKLFIKWNKFFQRLLSISSIYFCNVLRRNKRI